jgi:hypothetical protein
MKTTRAVPFAFVALSLALAGVARAADTGPSAGTISALVQAGRFDPQQTSGANNPLLTHGDATYAAPDVTAVGDKTRAQVEAELAQAVRTGDIAAPGNASEETMAQEFPSRYAGIATPDRASGMSSSSN